MGCGWFHLRAPIGVHSRARTNSTSLPETYVWGVTLLEFIGPLTMKRRCGWEKKSLPACFRDQRKTFHEAFQRFTSSKFDGTRVTV